MPRRDAERYQGVVLHDHRVVHTNFDTTNSVYTEAGPKPDQPTPTGAVGFMELEALGAPSASVSMDVQAVKEGAPVPGNEGGRQAYKLTSESATSWRGALEYNKPTGSEGWSGGTTYRQPTALNLQSGDLMVVGVAGTTQAIKGMVRDLSAGTWGSEFTAHTSTWGAGTSNAFGTTALVQLPSGRVLLFYTYPYDASGTTKVRLGMLFSDDDGGTWTQGATEIPGLDKALSSYDPNKIGAVFHNGYITLMLSFGNAAAGVGLHLVSDDQGASFSEVEELDGTTAALSVRDPHLFVDAAGNPILLYVDSNGVLCYTRKDSPYSKFQDHPDHGTAGNQLQSNVDTSVTATSNYCLTACLDDMQTVWVYYRSATTLGELKHLRFDLNQLAVIESRWTHNDAGNRYEPIDTGDAAMYFQEPAAALHGSQIFVLSTFVTPTTTARRNALTITKFGGWSSVDWQTQTYGELPGAGGYQVGWWWIAVELPDQLTTWNLSSSGTSTATINAAGLVVTCAASSSHYWTKSLANDQPMLLHWQFKADTITGTPNVGLEVYNATTRVRVRYESGQVVFFDLGASSNIATASLTTSTEHEYLLYAYNLKAALWYREVGAEVWTLVGSSTSLTAGTSTFSIQWGAINVGAGQQGDHTWRWLGAAVGDEPDDPDLTSLSRPEGLQGRPFSVYRQYMHGGVYHQSRGSSAYRGDTWTSATRATYGVHNLDLTRSPGSGESWRSTGDGTQAELVWKLNDGSSTRFLGDVLGLFLRANFRTAEVYLGSPGSWIKVGDVDAEGDYAPSSGSLGYGLDGDTVYPSTATRSQQYVKLDGVDYVEAAWTGGSGSSPAVFEVDRSRPGLWSTGSPSPALRLKDNHNSDLANIGTATTIKLYSAETLTLVYNVSAKSGGASAAYLRIVIPAQDTAEGYFEIKTLLFGEVMAFGQVSGWGTLDRVQPNRALTTARSGRRTARRLGRRRREAEFAWSGGWDGRTTTGQLSKAPDYLSPNSGVTEAWGVYQDLYLPEQLMVRTDGFTLPLVYVSELPEASGTAVESATLSGQHTYVYGLITNETVSRQLNTGQPTDPVYSINQYVLSEEV